METNAQHTQEPRLTDEDIPLGFRFAGVRAGIKASGNPDLACAVAGQAASAAAMFTSNRICAAPLLVGQRHLRQTQNRMRAVVVNSGNANCATGEPGILAAQQVCASAAEFFGCDAHEVFPSSTGIIGVPLPEEKLIAALPAANSALGNSAAHLEQFARAIMTTDTRIKLAAARVEVEGQNIRLVGVAKGAGMIYPQLTAAPNVAPHATMLVYLFTDAAIEPAAAADFLSNGVETAFNRISIDGDTSTNDTVLLLASGAAGVAIDQSQNVNSEFAQTLAARFSTALNGLCLSLAKQIVGDGEGIEHVIELNVSGALSDSDALRVARSIAHSPLVKTSWAGCDPNWGRILAAVGYSGVAVNPGLVSIYFGEMELCHHGCISPHMDKAAAHKYLQQRELCIRVDLGLGQGACRFWTTDLTAEYVHINAGYST